MLAGSRSRTCRYKYHNPRATQEDRHESQGTLTACRRFLLGDGAIPSQMQEAVEKNLCAEESTSCAKCPSRCGAAVLRKPRLRFFQGADPGCIQLAPVGSIPSRTTESRACLGRPFGTYGLFTDGDPNAEALLFSSCRDNPRGVIAGCWGPGVGRGRPNGVRRAWGSGRGGPERGAGDGIQIGGRGRPRPWRAWRRGGQGASLIERNARNTTGGATAPWQIETNGMAPAYPNAWLRLQRSGATLAAYASTNGANSVQQGWDNPATVGATTPCPQPSVPASASPPTTTTRLRSRPSTNPSSSTPWTTTASMQIMLLQ